ncbi:T9SS type A sorting domain-containing protein [Hymenobacter rubidus]|uniref:T9SS type A sorting domain-containing protein n=1 Tax=Hymenobacter rubidus TaxID=1441626 RepID=UPI001920285F|nr:T9SS type A sorting domain-containing protein [Hymenobacter rubidus]
MQQNFYIRSYLLLGAFVACISSAFAQAPVATAKDITVNLDGSGSVFISPAQIDNNSQAACANTVFGIGGVVENTVLEGQALTLTAPTGNVFAATLYGRYETQPGATAPYDPTQPVYAFDPNSPAIIQSLLVGKTSASILATSNPPSQFSDPFYGIAKQLQVRATYATTSDAQQVKFTAPGTYNVALTVMNDCGSSFALAHVTVLPSHTVRLNANGFALVTPSVINDNSQLPCANATFGIGGVVSGVVRELQTLNLAAGAGNVLSTTLYGRYETIPGSIAPFDPTQLVYAFDPNSPAIVQNLVFNRASASILANSFPGSTPTALFSDPFYGIAKQLKVENLFATTTANEQVRYEAPGIYDVALITQGCGSTPTYTFTTVTVLPYEGSTVTALRQSTVPDVSSVSSVVSVAKQASLVLDAYPNPSTDGRFSVHVQATLSGPVQVNLFDMQGNLVSKMYDGQLELGEQRDFTVNRPELRQGLYIVRVQNGKQVSNLRVEVQK